VASAEGNKHSLGCFSFSDSLVRLSEMKFVDVVVLLFALLTIGMGVTGYVAPTTGHASIISLVAGVAIGALLIGSLALAKTNPRAGRIGAAIAALLPLGRFLPAYIKEHNIYPAGIMVIGSFITVGVLVGGHFAAMSKKTR